MKGLELARAYWEECGLPMMERNFPQLLSKVASGLCGSGSECFGFDDEISRDHDFEPSFCLFLPGEDVVTRREEFLLERAYAKLPDTFCGVRRSPLSPVGGNRHGPIRAERFWTEKLGNPSGKLTEDEWLTLPDHALAEATNGEIFRDDSGFFTAVRENLIMPEDVRKKKLAGQLFLIGQAGQYNVTRCLLHGETGAARLAAHQFVRAYLSAYHLFCRRPLPYYKWAFRSLRSLADGEKTALMLEEILAGGEGVTALIELLCRDLSEKLRAEDPSLPDTAEMETLSYAVNDRIQSAHIRNLHLLCTVSDS